MFKSATLSTTDVYYYGGGGEWYIFNRSALKQVY